MKYQIRDFKIEDSIAINEVALAAFSEYQQHYSDWSLFSKNISKMSSLTEHAQLFVACIDETTIVGGVAYVPAGKPKNIFPSEWAIIRMLVVDPCYRGLGIGRALSNHCLEYAKKDNVSIIGLHTSPIMKTALNLYLGMGFKFEREVPPIYGVPYNIYTKHLDANVSLK